jgi:hypothetical protein
MRFFSDNQTVILSSFYKLYLDFLSSFYKLYLDFLFSLIPDDGVENAVLL